MKRSASTKRLRTTTRSLVDAARPRFEPLPLGLSTRLHPPYGTASGGVGCAFPPYAGLLVAIWQFLEHGRVPEGAVLKAAG